MLKILLDDFGAPDSEESFDVTYISKTKGFIRLEFSGGGEVYYDAADFFEAAEMLKRTQNEK